jgi:hypothetical protein
MDRFEDRGRPIRALLSRLARTWQCALHNMGGAMVNTRTPLFQGYPSLACELSAMMPPLGKISAKV